MTADLVSIIRAIVDDRLRGLRSAELATVTEIHPHAADGDMNNAECDVRLRDSGLVLKRVPVATQRVGAAAIPALDDLVLVQFLNFDLGAPVITARLYNDKDRPPVGKGAEFVYVSPDAASGDVRRLHLEFPNGNTVTLRDDGVTLAMGTTTLSVKHDGDVKVDAGRREITLVAGSNSVTLSSSGAVKVAAQTRVTVDAPMIEFVGGATHPLVHGDQLLQYLAQIVMAFQTHTHPGQMAAAIPVTPAPPLPPLPSPPPSLVSTKVMTG